MRILAILALLALSSCVMAQPSTRDQIAAELPAIQELDLEARRIQQQVAALGAMGFRPDVAMLREHLDTYYILYHNSLKRLAEGDIEGYRSRLSEAEHELAGVRAVLEKSEWPQGMKPQAY